MNYSLHMVRKYAKIFVRGHYLFLEVRKTIRFSKNFVNLKVASLHHF